MNERIGFPSFVTQLPEAAVQFPGVRGWISQSRDHQVVFLFFPAGSSAAPHRHGAQWGVVLSGELVLTMNEITHRYGPGEWHHVPAGVTHAATFPQDTWLIDIFEEPDRYQARRG
jgi:quercetin dioxygenase-like cupin family protein